MKPNRTLFNGSADFLPPDWHQFDALEIHPVCEDEAEGFSEIAADEAHATYWSVYGHLTTGGVDCITDVSTFSLAFAAAEKMAELAAKEGTTLKITYA
tara:strand:+ start:58 stop:351 length:294 start_codon:yes stop_codon:yes gene_type:complete